MLPDYLVNAAPVPGDRRGPWYSNIAPSYAGVFLWIAFYEQLAVKTLTHGSVMVCLFGLAVAAVLCCALYYFVPAMLGMKTGLPLYVVGSSTFGAKGGYIMPGLLMGLLQIGWFAVCTFFAADFILKGLGLPAAPGTPTFVVAGVVWGVLMAWVGVKGIRYVARVSLVLNAIPLIMLLVVFFHTAGGISAYRVPAGQEHPYAAFSGMLAVILGFFATGGAAGADFAMNARNASDVKWGGIVGIILPVLVAGGLPLLSVAGAHGLAPSLEGFDYDAVIRFIGGPVGSAMFLLFAIASIPPTCFCAFIVGNCFSTMIPRVSRGVSTMTGAAIGIILAVTGVAANLISFFTIVGASFGPICGAMAADYLVSGRRWAGPRAGINWAGYAAWAMGFVVGVLPFLPLPAEVKTYAEPAVLYSFLVGFVVYAVLAKMGLAPRVIDFQNGDVQAANTRTA